jgi:hypothetical protein
MSSKAPTYTSQKAKPDTGEMVTTYGGRLSGVHGTAITQAILVGGVSFMSLSFDYSLFGAFPDLFSRASPIFLVLPTSLP